MPTTNLYLNSITILLAHRHHNVQTISHAIIMALTILLLSPCMTAAAPVRMRSLTIYDGLAGESVNCIAKSPSGMIWAGTVNGVTIYDGNEMRNINVNLARAQNIIYDIAFTEDHTAWVGSSSGLYRMDPEKGIFSLASDLVQDKVSSVCARGNTLFAGSTHGFYVFRNNKRWQVKMSRDHLSKANNVEDIKTDARGGVWILGGRELYKYNEKTKKAAPVGLREQLRIHNNMRRMTIAGERIFIGTYNDGLLVYNMRTGKVSRYVDVECRVVVCVSNDGKYLYVGTDGAGLKVISLMEDRMVKEYTTSPCSEMRLLDNTVYSFYRDRSGVCFFGYFRRGIHHSYNGSELFKCYSTPHFNSDSVNVRSICIDGKVKVLGSRGGLYYIDEESQRYKFFTPEELGGSIVTNVVKYNNMYYCCTFNGGVMRIDPETLTTSRFGSDPALATGSFSWLAVSPGNQLNMASNTGLYIYDSGTCSEKVLNSQNSQLYNSQVYNILFDRQRRCWISTNDGICLYDPVDDIVRAGGFPYGFFNKAQDANGVIGHGSNLIFFGINGIYRTNEELTSFGRINTQQTIGGDYVSQVIYDPYYKNYWIGTERGLFKMDTTFTHVTKFAQEVGLNSREFSNNAIFIDKERRLWTGTVKGLYYASLDSLQKYDVGNVPIHLSEMMIGSRHISFGELVSIVSSHTIRLSYHWGIHTLSFQPCLLNFSDQAGLCFEYRIGDDGPWTVLKNNERAVIDHGLSIGHNVLQVRLAGQRHITEYEVYVWPSTAYVCEWIAFILMTVAVAIVYGQRRRLRRQREEMQRVQKELEEVKRKYSRVNTNEDEQQRLLARLEEYMRHDKPYLSQEVKLSDIASHLDISTVKLSQLFNVYLQRNYYDFMNHYRLEEFKRRIDDKRYAHYTLLALAEECGFKRSSFFATFKKVEGITPTEYVKRHRGG